MRELIALAACLPCLFVVWRIQSRFGSRSSRQALWVTFALGAVSTSLVLALAPHLARPLGASMPAYVRDLGQAFLLAALPEETVKFLVVIGFALARGHLRDARTGVAHGLAASLGFASVEMILFARDGGVEAAVVRTVTTAPCHAFLGTVMGFLVGRAVARHGIARHGVALRSVAPGLAVPMFVHGAYDLPLMSLDHAGPGAAASNAWAQVGLTLIGATVLVVGCVVGHRIFRSVFPRAVEVVAPLSLRDLAARALGSRTAATSMIPVGGALASAGAWIVGSLLFVEFRGLESVPNAADAISLLHAVGLSLVCFGLALGFRGIRLRHAGIVRS